MRNLASPYHERLYTLGVDGDGSRRGMDKGGEGKNDSRRGFPLFEMLRL